MRITGLGKARPMKLLLLPIVLAASVLAVACGKDVSAINKKPEKFAGKTVKLEGVIKSVVSVPPTAGVPGMTLYQISDKTGGDEQSMIWVIRGPESTQKALPNPNHRIKLEGVIEAQRQIRNTTYGPVIIEKDAQEEIPRDAPASFG